MLHFVSFILASAFCLATAAKMEYCPIIRRSPGATENCSSIIYNRSDASNQSVEFCVQTEFRCSTMNTDEPIFAILRCRNLQETLKFEHTISGYRNDISTVNFTICRTWSSTPEACSFQAAEPDPSVDGWSLLVESKAVPSFGDCNCKPYWEYADAQWQICNGSGSYNLGTLLAVRVLVIAGLAVLAVAGCVAFSVKFKQGLARVDTTVQSA